MAERFSGASGRGRERPIAAHLRISGGREHRVRRAGEPERALLQLRHGRLCGRRPVYTAAYRAISSRPAKSVSSGSRPFLPCPNRMCVSAPDRRLKASGASAGAIGCSSIESECAAHIAASAKARNCSSIESGCAAHIAASAGARDCSSIESICAARIAASAGARNCSSIESGRAARIERFQLEKRRIAVKYKRHSRKQEDFQS